MAKAKKDLEAIELKSDTVETAIEVENGDSAVQSEADSPENVIAAPAKAGKRSTKSQKEAAEKEAKEERKATVAKQEPAEKPKQTAKPTRTREERSSKRYREAAKKIEKGKSYSPNEALNLAIETGGVKFDATVELHVNLNVDPHVADQNVRDNLVLPSGTGRSIRVAVLSDDSTPGADVTGIETITKGLEKGIIDFDILIATPTTMPRLRNYARLLGPRGLMPNPKSGTVTNDIDRAVAEAKAGRVEYRVDATGIVHVGIGKVSFGGDKLMDNFQAIITSIKSNKPASVKGNYIKSVHVTTTMGPSISVALSEL